MIMRIILLVVAVLLLGCSRPVAKPPTTVPNPTPTQAVPPGYAPPPPAPAPVAQEIPVEIIRIARPNRLGEQTEIARFTLQQGHIALSPDGRYLLYASCDPCDERRSYTPLMLDRSAGKIHGEGDPS